MSTLENDHNSEIAQQLRAIAEQLGTIAWELPDTDYENYEALEVARRMVNRTKRAFIRKAQEGAC